MSDPPTGHHASIAEAVAEWNRRAPSTSEPTFDPTTTLCEQAGGHTFARGALSCDCGYMGRFLPDDPPATPSAVPPPEPKIADGEAERLVALLQMAAVDLRDDAQTDRERAANALHNLPEIAAIHRHDADAQDVAANLLDTLAARLPSLLRAEQERDELAKRQDFWVRSVQDLETSLASASLRAAQQEQIAETMSDLHENADREVVLLRGELSGLSKKVRALPPLEPVAAEDSFNGAAMVDASNGRYIERSAVLSLLDTPDTP